MNGLSLMFGLTLVLLFSCKTENTPPATICPFKEIVTTTDSIVENRGVEHHGKIGLAIQANLKQLGKLKFEISDSIKGNQQVKRIVSYKGMEYTSEQVIEHNKLIGLICGRHLLWEQEKNLARKQDLSIKLDDMVDRYFDFLLPPVKLKEESNDSKDSATTITPPPPVPTETEFFVVNFNLLVDDAYKDADIILNGKKFLGVQSNGGIIAFTAEVPRGNCQVQVIPEHEDPCSPTAFFITSDSLLNYTYICK